MNTMPHLLDEAAVFVASDSYDIIWNTSVPGLAWVDCGGKRFYDHANGNIKSEETIHKITVPADLLDNSGKYTVFFRESIDRRAYFPLTGEEESKTYSFRPVKKKDDYEFYFIADTHSEYETPCRASKSYKKTMDFLVLGGDIPTDCESFEEIRTIFRIAAEITDGEIPVVSARGNHDTRGHIAPLYHKYSPLVDGQVYFTFELGSIFGIILDCGEDKPDNHPEYGFVNCFEPYRRGVTAFLERVTAEEKYKSFDHVLVICHERVDAANHGLFISEYEKWVKCINKISPDAMLCGHEHECRLLKKGRRHFDTDTVIDFDTIIAGQVRGNPRTNNSDKPAGYTGCRIRLSKDVLTAEFTNDKSEVEETHNIRL